MRSRSIRGRSARRSAARSNTFSSTIQALQLRAAEYLAREQGRAAPRFCRRSPSGAPRVVPPFPAGAGVVGPLASLVRHSWTSDADWVRSHLVFDVLVVDTLETASRLHREGFPRKVGHARRPGASSKRRCGRVVPKTSLPPTCYASSARFESSRRPRRRRVHTLERGDEQSKGGLRASIAERQAAIDSARSRGPRRGAGPSRCGARSCIVVEMELEAHRRAPSRRSLAPMTEAARQAVAQIDVDESNTRGELGRGTRSHVERCHRSCRAWLRACWQSADASWKQQAARATEVKVRSDAGKRERADRERSVLAQLDRSIAELNAREDRLT